MYTCNSCLATLGGPSNNFKRIFSLSLSHSLFPPPFRPPSFPLFHLQSQEKFPVKE